MNKLPPTPELGRRLPAAWNIFVMLAFVNIWPLSAPAQPQPQRLNNLTALLLEAAPTRAGETFSFTCPRTGWVFISAATSGDDEVRLALDGNEKETILLTNGAGSAREAMRHVTAGNHVLRAAAGSAAAITKITV